MSEIDIAKKVFQGIQNEFPSIAMHINENHEHVELDMEIPKQEGISQAINLNLQNNDELHFSVGNFWCEWFPCNKPEETSSYKKVVIGYINGTNRILEHYKGRKCYKAELQSPSDNAWVTVATWSTISWPFSFNKARAVVQNA